MRGGGGWQGEIFSYNLSLRQTEMGGFSSTEEQFPQRGNHDRVCNDPNLSHPIY